MAKRKPKPKPKPKKAKLDQSPEARRARRRDRDPLYNPGAQLSGNRLALAASQLTDLEFKPKEDALASQLKTATTQGTALAGRAGDYYKTIAQGEADRVANQQALRNRLTTSLQFLGDTTSGQIDQAQAKASEAARANQELRGGIATGGDQQVQGELAARKATAALTAQGYKGDAELQSGNYEGLQSAMAGTRQLRGGEVQGQLLNRLATQQAGIRQQEADLSSQRGATKTKHVLDLRQTGFENAATIQGLGIKQADIEAQSETAKASQKAAAARQREVARANRAREKLAAGAQGETGRHNQATESTAQQNANTAANRKPKKPKTPDRVFNARSDITTAQGVYQSKYRGNFAKYSRAMEREGYKGPIIHAGFEMANQGYIGPNTARSLRIIGVTVPAAWLRGPSPARQGQRTGSNVASGAASALSGLFG